jgi:hypothetical protein
MYRGRDDGSRGGAEHLARIHGTEEDKVNCPFYFKIGACRHGEKCSRQHHKPPFSQTIIVPHMWAVRKIVKHHSLTGPNIYCNCANICITTSLQL